MMMFEKGLGFTPKSLNPKHIIRPWWYQVGKEHGGVWQEFDHTENEQFFSSMKFRLQDAS